MHTFKYLLTVIFFLSIVCSPGFAAMVGSPASLPLELLEDNRPYLGAEGTVINKRELETPDSSKKQIDDSTHIGLTLGYGLATGMMAYAKFGTADWIITSDTTTRFDYKSTPYIGGGFSYAYKTDSNIILGGDIQYIRQSRVALTSLIHQGVAATTVTGLAAEITDLQVSLLLGYAIAADDDVLITPYAGALYSAFNVKTAAGSFNAATAVTRPAETYRTDNALGLIAGIGIKTGGQLTVTAETRIISESAVSLGFNYRF